jgi:hypothetical protein
VHATKVQHAQFPVDIVMGETSRAAPLHFVPSSEEVSNAIIDVIVDRPICLQPRAVTKIRRPTDQKPIQSNGAKLNANRTNLDVLPGPAREGLCLLQGMLVCGCCGGRVSVRYTGSGGVYPMYLCGSRRRRSG